jgi:very-short-patch-repair endonuclease
MMHRAEEMRREQTEGEAMLWSQLRAHRMNDIHFRRQYAIGRYIVDFCAVRRKLVIEVDGSPHLEQKENDDVRTHFLESQGYRVLRFWNGEVMNNLDTVLGIIREAINNH